MAKIFYLLKQNKNQTSRIYGKWFAHGKTIETLNTRKMANHIAEHGSIYTPDVVFWRTRRVEQTRRKTSTQPRI